MITIIDYGLGNLSSIKNMLKKISADSIITDDVQKIRDAKKLILPGVGAFDTGMKNLRAKGLIEILKEKVLVEKMPILGICLGMQLLTTTSEEGIEPGLNFIDAKTIKFIFPQNSRMKVPHMSWSDIQIKEYSHPLFKGVIETPRYYFVHSYHVKCSNVENILAEACYGNNFTSIIGKDNIIGVQFHPEKSHSFGMHILQNFSAI